ncbi:MAG: CYTH domain-containing protein [Muribaculaceae bacterium]|nr:CYTH domain-containing protein [Muribaculaceae bacterium]
MGKEIERKFLVNGNAYKALAVKEIHMCQGYLCTDPHRTVRVRIADDVAYLTIKGITTGASRSEWEYKIPVDDARAILEECCAGKYLSKTRYIIPVENCNLFWEIDEFHGQLSGLVLAEIELPSEDMLITLPEFIGSEVTGQKTYYNSSLLNSLFSADAPRSQHDECEGTCPPAEQP